MRDNRFLIFIAVGFAAVNAIVWSAVFETEASSAAARLHFFDVGQGDAIFVEMPNGSQALIDGGPDDAVLAKLGEAMPFWDRYIDLVVLTHPHADHVSGLIEVLRRYDVGMVLESGANYSTPEYQEWKKVLEEKGIKPILAKSGGRIRFGDSAYLDVIAPDKNAASSSPKNIHDAMVVMKFVNDGASAIFTGDGEKNIERRLTFSGVDLDSDILKVGHHGSKTSTTDEFLDAVSPEVAVISAGRRNRYGHPHHEVLDRLQLRDIGIFRTDVDGDITFVIDGGQFSLEK